MEKGSKAFIFDLNGTLIDDMHYHAKAWYNILNDRLNAGLTMDQVKNHMYGKNEEVLKRIFGNERFTDAEMDVLGVDKEKSYQQAYFPDMKPMQGLVEFLDGSVKRGIPLAIGSAAIPFNIDFVLDNLHLRKFFPIVVSAHDVHLSKPHPETFTKAAELLGVKPADCVVFEDAPKGVEAALNAGMKAVVLTTTHEREDFQAYPNILLFAKDYTDNALLKILDQQ